jgi:hypothetical protein
VLAGVVVQHPDAVADLVSKHLGGELLGVGSGEIFNNVDLMSFFAAGSAAEGDALDPLSKVSTEEGGQSLIRS